MRPVPAVRLLVALPLVLAGCASLGEGLLPAVVVLGTTLAEGAPSGPLGPPAPSYEALEGVTVPDSVSAADLAGTYVRAGYHGHRSLDLRSDGTLAYRVVDAFTRVDTTVTGHWAVGGRWADGPSQLSLDVPKVRGASGGPSAGEHSPLLDVVRHGGQTLLVPRNWKGAVLQFGPTRSNTFWPGTQAR